MFVKGNTEIGKNKFQTSSIVNEGIRAILNLFFFFFYKKISHAQKAQNAQKA